MTTSTLNLIDAPGMTRDVARKTLVPPALRDLLDEVGQVLKGSVIGMRASVEVGTALRRDIGLD